MRASLSTCVVLILLLLVLLIRCCDNRKELQAELDRCSEELEDCLSPDGGKSGGGAASTHAHLIIEGRSAGDWIQFASLPTDESCDPSAVNYRPAVLFQFGEYLAGPDTYFDRILVYKTGETVPQVFEKEDAATGEPLRWFNIVSEYADRPDPPIDPDEIFGLYPDSGLPGGCEDAPCERNRTIHGDMKDVQAVMTYWPGVNGYTMHAEQPKHTTGSLKDPCGSNRYEFTFHDRFRVEVYAPAFPSAGSPTVFSLGTVDSIVVETEVDPDPTKDEMQEPPWPRP